ncbi:MAG: AlpA family phage regulatory protein [Proteobacteria bacterium]|nr:MAG: AlpA family phage regulatory protein [Pseudomonadota bacterium]
MQQTTVSCRLLPRREVEHETGLSRSTIYRLMDAGKFPRPRRTAARKVGWRASDVEAWKQSRPAHLAYNDDPAARVCQHRARAVSAHKRSSARTRLQASRRRTYRTLEATRSGRRFASNHCSGLASLIRQRALSSRWSTIRTRSACPSCCRPGRRAERLPCSDIGAASH